MAEIDVGDLLGSDPKYYVLAAVIPRFALTLSGNAALIVTGRHTCPAFERFVERATVIESKLEGHLTDRRIVDVQQAFRQHGFVMFDFILKTCAFLLQVALQGSGCEVEVACGTFNVWLIVGRLCLKVAPHAHCQAVMGFNAIKQVIQLSLQQPCDARAGIVSAGL